MKTTRIPAGEFIQRLTDERGWDESLHAPVACARCGRDPASGFASIGDEWFCHGDNDPEPTCYMQAQAELGRV